MDFTGRLVRGFVFVNAERTTSEVELASWPDLALDINPRAVSSRSKKKALATKVQSAPTTRKSTTVRRL